MIPVEEAAPILAEEARRIRAREKRAKGGGSWWMTSLEDWKQDGWVILLEQDPHEAPLARVVLRRRLANKLRDACANKRGDGVAVGRMDAGWDEDLGEDPSGVLLDAIAIKQLLDSGFKPSTGDSRQAQHQARQRALARWSRKKRPYD